MKFNLSRIMHNAWKFFRKLSISFSAALTMAWVNEKNVIRAKESAEVQEETHTWSGWKSLGFEVIHESKSLFKALTVDPSTKSGTRIVAYFGRSQVQPIEA